MRRFFLTTLPLVCLLSVTTGCEKKSGGSDPAATEPAGATATSAVLEGTIRLSESLKVEQGNVLYVIARKGTEGPPAAVQRIENPVFPLAYSLGAKDSMVPGVPFGGPLAVKARLSRSGDAMPQPGDVEGFYPDPVAPGAKGVDIVLAQVR